MKTKLLSQFRGIYLLVLFTCSLAILAIAQTPIGFGVSDLSGASSYLCTSLQFGPDNRLYVSQQDGIIKAYTIVRLGANNYIVTGEETILGINAIPNHNDNGVVNNAVNYRQITGIAVYGTAANPVIWVTSSDPRIGAGPLGTDTDLDTNSGVVSTLTWNGSAWVRQDIVRGLPRSEENHSLNGLVLDTANNMLYVCAGGNTNMGARSNNFALAPEYAYSAAILSVDLDAIVSFPYDLPTLDDEDRSGVNDLNDPFGGNDGKNQAMLEIGGPVQIHASGFRNPYDVVLTESGRMYSWDNGPNANWGAAPVSCVDAGAVEGGQTYADGLHYVPSAGYYGGHPNLTRANRSNTFNASNPQSPIPLGMENPAECTYLIPNVADQTIVLHSASTNGLAVYNATNFDSAMNGYLLAATFDGKIIQVELNAAGDDLGAGGKTTLFSGFGSTPLDVIAVGDDGPFPGTIWAANIYGEAPVTVFEPNDYGGGSGLPCDFSVLTEDSDLDGYTNGDEIDNATNPCSAADKPHDWDHDFISDLNDPDDDNDGIPDISDVFALDANNGLTTFMPVDYEWEPGDPARGGFFDLGFTGMMNNGNSDYLNQYNIDDITAGGTAGLFTIDAMTEGTAFSSLNIQDNAFQFGVNMDTVTRPFVIQTRIRSPYGGSAPIDFQTMGMFFGTGDMDNYIKLVVHSLAGAGGLEYQEEFDGIITPFPLTKKYPASVIGAVYVDLYLTIDPLAGTVQPSYSINGGFPTTLDGARSFPLSWLDDVLAIGIIGSSNGAAPEFPATWDYIIVKTLGPQPAATLNVSAGNFLSSDIIADGSFVLTNTSINGGNIEQVTIDLSTLVQPDMVFDPFGTAGDNAFKNLTANAGDSATGFIGHSFDGLRDGGYDKLILNFNNFEPTEVFTFSIDIDPTSIKGLSSPGPNSAGKISGLEMTGAKVDIHFDNGADIGGKLFLTAGSQGASKNRFDEDTLAAPSIAFLGGVTSPSNVTDLNYTVRVSGQAGASARLLQLEGGMFLRGNPGFDVDPFESNSIIKRTEYNAVIGLSGYVDIPVVLSDNDDEGGLNHFIAVLDGGIKTSDISNKLILQLGVDTIPPVGLTSVNINCGGPAFTTISGVEYQADQYFGTSTTYTNNTIPDILGTVDDVLYRTERNNTTLNYSIPMENGDYEVVLHFAEIFYGAAGGGLPGADRRVFDVNIEGAQVLNDLDLFDSVGHSTALVATFPVSLSDGLLNLDFIASINRGKISAIQVRPVAGPMICAVDSVIIGAQGACDSISITYTQALTIYASNAPDSGNVIVNGQVFAVTSSPQTVVLTGLASDGLSVDLSVAYSLDTACVFLQDSAWLAPADCTPIPVCAVPTNIQTIVMADKISLDWDDVPGATRYQIAGRKAGTTNFRYILTVGSMRQINNLLPSNTYEYQIRAACPFDTSDFSPLATFVTLAARVDEGLVQASALGNVRLSPNPAQDFTWLSVNAMNEGSAKVVIRDLTGRAFSMMESQLVAGENTLQLETGNLQNGLYLVEIRQGDQAEVKRLEIIR